jgi:1-deoxy-D-xylulose-5-phosphate synthase
VFDLAYLRAIPNMTICSPMNEVELRNLMYTAQLPDMGPFAIRYPRNRGMNIEWKHPFEAIPVGKGRMVRDGKDLAILSIGHEGNYAIEAAGILSDNGIDAAVYDLRFLKPLDEELLSEVFRKFGKIITVEDGTIVGGLDLP